MIFSFIMNLIVGKNQLNQTLGRNIIHRSYNKYRSNEYCALFCRAGTKRKKEYELTRKARDLVKRLLGCRGCRQDSCAGIDGPPSPCRALQRNHSGEVNSAIVPHAATSGARIWPSSRPDPLFVGPNSSIFFRDRESEKDSFSQKKDVTQNRGVLTRFAGERLAVACFGAPHF